jgi:outer membrane protein, multidrug efflux system
MHYPNLRRTRLVWALGAALLSTELPCLAEDSDPMLVEPAAAPRQIASWDDALALVRAQSPDYVSSGESVERAEAQKRIALAAVLPTLAGQASYTHQFSVGHFSIGGTPIVSPSPDLWSVGATLAWTVVNPRGIYGVGTAGKGIDVARLSFEDRRRELAMALVDGMLATLAASRVAELNRVGLRAALDRLALTKARLEFGQGTALDVDRAEQDAESAREVLVSGDESLRQSRETLGAALGSPVALAPPDDLDLEAFESAVVRSCRLNEDVEHRPDVAAARARVEIAERTVRDADLQLAPTLAVVSEVGYATAPVLAPNATWAIEGVLNVPFYDGGARYGAMRDARAALEQARQALVATRLAAVVESERARRSVAVLQASRDVSRRKRDLAKSIDGRTRDGYAHGLGTSLDLVISAEALRQADIDLALLEFQVGSARAHAVLADAECVY